MFDEHFERYREIGERNRVVLRLLSNWCAHAQVARESGQGLMEQMTGLPLSMCRVTCRHERAQGSISMHLEENALSFYDRNCVDCAERRPVALPNLSQLVGQRDSAREDAKRRQAEAQKAAGEALQVRQVRRQRAFASQTPAQASLVLLLDRLDTEATADTAEELVAAVVAVPEELSVDFLAAIADVVGLGGTHRSVGGLRALDASSFPRRDLVVLAIEALKRGERAASILDLVACYLDHADRADIHSIAPTLVWASRTSHFALPEEANGHTAALLRAHTAHPEIVESAIHEALRQESKEWRNAACSAATALLEERRDIDVELLCVSLVASLRLPDSIEDEGPSYEVVARLLGTLLLREPTLVLPHLLRHEGDEHEEVKVGIFRAYCAVLDRRGLSSERGDRDNEDRWGPESAQSQVLSRILSLATNPPNDVRVQEAVELLEKADDWLGQFADPSDYVPTMLGAAAMACTRVEANLRPSELVVDPRPADVQQLERGADANWLARPADALVELVAWTASEHPAAEARLKSGEFYLETLRALTPMANRLRSSLVRHLGKIYRSRDWRNVVLPEIYTALAHPSIAVRAAASRAYEDVCGVVGPDALPSLLHEAFLLHLQDPYVAVHKGAVAALMHIAVPEQLTEQVIVLLVRIVDAYTAEEAERRDDYFVADALSVVVRLLAPENVKGLGYVVRVASGLRPEALYSLLQKRIRRLRDVPGIADLVLLLPYRPSIWQDYQSEFLLKELALLPRAEIARAAGRIVEVGVEAGRKRIHSVIPLVRLLDANGEGAAAQSLVARVLAAAGEDRVNLRERLMLSLYRDAMEVETAAAAGSMDRVQELATSIQAIEEQLAEDQLVNQQRRQHDAFD